jgi:hypothetical protein
MKIFLLTLKLHIQQDLLMPNFGDKVILHLTRTFIRIIDYYDFY